MTCTSQPLPKYLTYNILINFPEPLPYGHQNYHRVPFFLKPLVPLPRFELRGHYKITLKAKQEVLF
jgi:hypothetical protein